MFNLNTISILPFFSKWKTIWHEYIMLERFSEIWRRTCFLIFSIGDEKPEKEKKTNKKKGKKFFCHWTMPVTPQEEKWILFWRISFRICREDARVQRCFRRLWVYYCFVSFGICLISLARHFCLLFPVSAACRCPFKLCIVPVWVALMIESSLNTQKKEEEKDFHRRSFTRFFLQLASTPPC